MAITSGFFDSINGDRKYNAQQMSSIFDGLVADGIYQSIGSAFSVSFDGTNIVVGSGRAWFNHVWALNDAPTLLKPYPPEVVLSRIDEVILDVDSSDAVRAASLTIVKGAPASSPVRPQLISTATRHQYSLASISVAPSQPITQANITNRIGTTETPFVIGIIKSMSIDFIVAKWSDQWNQWFAEKTATGSGQMDAWTSSKQQEFDSWFTNLQDVLSDNVETNLATQILDLTSKFDSLRTDQTLWDTVKDSTGESITDSENNAISGKLVFALR